MTKIKHFFYWLFIAKSSGLSPTPEDPRDFKTGIFNWFGYEPKHTKHIIPTVSVKSQLWNTCQWNATIVQKEPDEKMSLSVRLMVTKGNRMGFVSGDGFSNLRDGQKVLQDWGAVKEHTINEVADSFTKYVNNNPDLYNDRAADHKIASYWSVSSRTDLLKLLDENRIVTTGLVWYTGFNQGGGFKSPWTIHRAIGYSVGGHAIAIIGYDMSYYGQKVYICQNSYGEEWGDNGKFYITMDYLDANNYGYYTHLDEVDVELSKFIIAHDGKNVKAPNKPGIYHIQAGKRKPYPNWETYLSWNGLVRGFSEVDGEVLSRVPEGELMDITKTDYWKFLKDVQEANRLSALLELLNKE